MSNETNPIAYIKVTLLAGNFDPWVPKGAEDIGATCQVIAKDFSNELEKSLEKQFPDATIQIDIWPETGVGPLAVVRYEDGSEAADGDGDLEKVENLHKRLADRYSWSAD